VFAPTDAAFQSMGEADLAKLMNDKAALQKLLTHHIINAPVDSSKIKGARGPVPSVAQDQILLDGSEEGALKADGATIVQADVRA
ncbi:fasciclin domain-containing protein, partial [Shewanella sp. A25]|nr:fasciclin domain-containing protein [Shewanella shenzhenensis]